MGSDFLGALYDPEEGRLLKKKKLQQIGQI
jgi:hypothetical protein